MIAEPHVPQLVSRLVQRIVSGYRPERIILFGSYAYLTPEEVAASLSQAEQLIELVLRKSFFPR
jgi:hypothetical protein